MHRKQLAPLLLCLCVLLLYIVSVRIGQTDITGALPENRRTEETFLDQWKPEEEQPDETGDAETALQLPEQETLKGPDLKITDWQYKLVDGIHILSSNFTPSVTEIADQQYFDSRAVNAINAMLLGAQEAGYSTCVRAAYRPYATQAYIFFGKASQIAANDSVKYEDAEMLARKKVAYPGTSEHQLGLCADIMDSADTIMSAEDVENLPVLLWLKKHCAEYGFILRYPKDKQEITGWYEPWHFRYVGEEAAAYIMENGLCLEEFIDLY